MQHPELFIYEPKQQLVTAEQAANLVTNSAANCHDFAVNPHHESPNIATLSARIEEMKLTPEHGEAYLMYLCIREALEAAKTGRYGVAAVLANVRKGAIEVIQTARNERQKGGKHQFTGHAEMRLVDQATPYLQQEDRNHASDVACVNLSPCPGCFGHMIDAHFPEVLVGSIDPEVGAAFLKGEKLQFAAGRPRQQVINDRNLQYRFPEIPDAQLRGDILTLSWEVFHTTRSQVHNSVHGGSLKE